MSEAPDIREQEDCPSAKACDGKCDQHEDHPSAPDDLRAEAAWVAKIADLIDASCDVRMNSFDRDRAARNIAAALPVLAADRDGEIERLESRLREVAKEANERTQVAAEMADERDEARAEVERLRELNAETIAYWKAQYETRDDEAREQLAARDQVIERLKTQRAEDERWVQGILDAVREVANNMHDPLRGLSMSGGEVQDTLREILDRATLADPGQWEDKS